MIPLRQVERGRWPKGQLPAAALIGGRLYRRAKWSWPRKGVVAQYREARARLSRHLYVREDGTWEVNHVDEVNPDGPGGALAHFWRDVL